MTMSSKTTSVKGGWIKRDAVTGRFIEVHTSKGAAKASPKSGHSVKEASSKRRSALKRLANR